MESIPRYVKIAHDIANKIVSGQYLEGQKIYARSYVASQYGVSSETARRAICVLSDLNIVENHKGSGVVIKSVDNARIFLKQHDNIRSVDKIKDEIKDSIKRQQNEMEHYLKSLDDLLYKVEKFRHINPFVPFSITIDEHTPFIRKSIHDIKLWHHTYATVIAVKREGELLISPGPYVVLYPNDTFYFIGDEDCEERVKEYLQLT